MLHTAVWYHSWRAQTLQYAMPAPPPCCRRRPLELLRKESLAGLSPAAACRVLAHSYFAVLPIAPLPNPPLPLNPALPGPA